MPSAVQPVLVGGRWRASDASGTFAPENPQTRALEGNLTGALYTDVSGADDAAYARLAPILRRKVGRLLNDKMPTGVAVSPAMNDGGPYPATGHPGFTAVGIPASLRRLFVTAHDVTPEQHVRMQAIFQRYSDSGVSKTINLPATASKTDVAEAFLLAYRLGCKGLTVFRTGSRERQVMSCANVQYC